jgi:methyl-accepting chemotaxis protein
MNYALLLASNEVTIDLNVLIMLFWVCLVIAMILVIGILWRVFQTVKDFRGIISDNRTSINQIINEVPQITRNIQEVTTEVSHATQVFRPSVDNIADTTQSVTDTIKNNNPVNEAIVSAYKTVNSVHKLVESFSKKNVEETKHENETAV